MRTETARIWSFRARAEREAACRFARLAERLAASGAAAEIVHMAERAASDEARHADLCRDLVQHFGGEPSFAKVDDPREVAPSGLAARERVLYEVVALSCITETLSAALLGAMIEKARDDRVEQTVRRILRDEIDHGRLGWAHLSLEQPRGVGRVLGDYLPAMLKGTIDDELFRDGDDSDEVQAAELEGFGALRRADRRALFVATMRDVVFPGLERFGIDTSSGIRWLAERSS
jgi:hypothetical protein